MNSTNYGKQRGFTLVELAVVMIIIGLLIGGVLKGQELIGNAQVTSTVSQVKGVDAAVSTFRDMYSALPGDIRTPNLRLPDCTGVCAGTAGDGNGRLSTTPAAIPGDEADMFFVHLNAADLITGIDPAGGTGAWGGQYPETPIRGTGLSVGSAQAAADIGTATTTGARSGLYLVLTATPNVVPAVSLTPNQASRIDNKLDDGIPGSGSTRSGGANCGSATAYAEATSDASCWLASRIQG